jgi:hypothetical protein
LSKLLYGIPRLCSLIEENIKENSNVCLLPNADKDDKPEKTKAEKEAKDEIVRPLNIDCVEAINHVISAKMLYNKLGTNQNNTYPDFF